MGVVVVFAPVDKRRWCAETTDGRCSGHPDRRHGM